jgi:hypothetical protein
MNNSRSRKAISDPFFIVTHMGRRKVQIVHERERAPYYVFQTAPGIELKGYWPTTKEVDNIPNWMPF